MKEKHVHDNEESCPVCKWLEQQVDSIDCDKAMEILRGVVMEPAACNAAVGLVYGLGSAAISMGMDWPETVEELLQVLAIVRLDAEACGKFTFEKP